MPPLTAPLTLIAARARRRPGRWLLTGLGIALAAAFAGSVMAEGTIAGDQAAHSVLSGLSPLDRTVRVTWQGVVTPAVRARAQGLLAGLGLGGQTEVVLLNPVRLGGIVVRPAAIEPLARWVAAGPGFGAGGAGVRQSQSQSCRASACPALLAGGTRLLAGLDVPDHGELLVDGRTLRDRDREQLAALRLGRVGYVSQEPAPIGFLSCEENVVLALALRGCEAAHAAERATVVLARVGLADRARQRVWRLSAGEAQRVALARALACARGLLIVDEPTSRLDETNAAAVAELLAAAAAEDRHTVVCATHDPQVIRYAERVVGLG